MFSEQEDTGKTISLPSQPNTVESSHTLNPVLNLRNNQSSVPTYKHSTLELGSDIWSAENQFIVQQNELVGKSNLPDPSNRDENPTESVNNKINDLSENISKDNVSKEDISTKKIPKGKTKKSIAKTNSEATASSKRSYKRKNTANTKKRKLSVIKEDETEVKVKKRAYTRKCKKVQPASTFDSTGLSAQNDKIDLPTVDVSSIEVSEIVNTSKPSVILSVTSTGKSKRSKTKIESTPVFSSQTDTIELPIADVSGMEISEIISPAKSLVIPPVVCTGTDSLSMPTMESFTSYTDSLKLKVHSPTLGENQQESMKNEFVESSILKQEAKTTLSQKGEGGKSVDTSVVKTKSRRKKSEPKLVMIDGELFYQRNTKPFSKSLGVAPKKNKNDQSHVRNIDFSNDDNCSQTISDCPNVQIVTDPPSWDTQILEYPVESVPTTLKLEYPHVFNEPIVSKEDILSESLRSLEEAAESTNLSQHIPEVIETTESNSSKHKKDRSEIVRKTKNSSDLAVTDCFIKLQRISDDIINNTEDSVVNETTIVVTTLANPSVSSLEAQNKINQLSNVTDKIEVAQKHKSVASLVKKSSVNNGDKLEQEHHKVIENKEVLCLAKSEPPVETLSSLPKSSASTSSLTEKLAASVKVIPTKDNEHNVKTFPKICESSATENDTALTEFKSHGEELNASLVKPSPKKVNTFQCMSPQNQESPLTPIKLIKEDPFVTEPYSDTKSKQIEPTKFKKPMKKLIKRTLRKRQSFKSQIINTLDRQSIPIGDSKTTFVTYKQPDSEIKPQIEESNNNIKSTLSKTVMQNVSSSDVSGLKTTKKRSTLQTRARTPSPSTSNSPTKRSSALSLMSELARTALEEEVSSHKFEL